MLSRTLSLAVVIRQNIITLCYDIPEQQCTRRLEIYKYKETYTIDEVNIPKQAKILKIEFIAISKILFSYTQAKTFNLALHFSTNTC